MQNVEESRNTLNSAIVNNIATNLKELNHGHGTIPEEKRKLLNAGVGLATGTCTATKTTPIAKLCKKLGVGRLNSAIKKKGSLLEKCFVPRKKRKDAIPDDHLKIAKDYWKSKSRPTGDKRDIKRKRIGLKSYKEHAKHVLDKTEREIYLEFKQEHPEIKMGQTSFTKCKPYFVVPARRKDRVTCLCRKHFEIRLVLLKACAKFCSTCQNNGSIDPATYPALNSTKDVAQMTLCQKQGDYYGIPCLTRTCDNCGVDRLRLSNQELDYSENVKVKWQRYGYIEVGEKEDG